MFTSIPSRSLLLVAAAVSLAMTASPLRAITVAHPFALDLAHVKTKPYNFTGRTFIYSNTAGGFGSATAIRRHTALTAAHVVFDPALGFVSRQVFNRGLLEDYVTQRFPVVSVGALSGYSTLASDSTVDFFDASERDLGYLLYSVPPQDEDWADTIPTDLASTTDSLGNPIPSPLITTPAGDDGTFVLGYPGETFDGATMAYIVPTQPYVDLGGGEFENDGYLAEEGMSGGPVYVVRSTGVDSDGNTTFSREVAAETVGGGTFAGGSASATVAVVRGIDAEATQLLASAEYAGGLIKKVKVTGPTSVAAGSTITITAKPKFNIPRTDGGTPLRPTTDRYAEIQLVSDTVGTPTNPAVTITKLTNTEFQVKFNSSLRSRSTIVFTAEYAPNESLGKSSLAVTIK